MYLRFRICENDQSGKNGKGHHQNLDQVDLMMSFVFLF